MAIDDPNNPAKRPQRMAPTGDVPQATAKAAQPAATRLAAPAGAPALPAPTITVNSAGDAMTNADMTRRAAMGNTPDVARATAARAAGSAPAVAAAPSAASQLAGATTSLGAAPPAVPAAGAPPPAPNWTTTQGVGGNGVVNPDATRAARVPAAPAPQWSMSDGMHGPQAQQPGVIRRAANAAGSVAGRAGSMLATGARAVAPIARGAGYLGAAAEGIGAVNDAAAGDYASAAPRAGMAALDVAAVRAPSPVTIGAALAAHGTDMALNTSAGQRLTQGIADNLPGSGRQQVDQTINDMRGFIDQREQAGRPLGTARDRLTQVENQRAQDFGGVTYLDPANRFTANQGPIAGGATRPPAAGTAPNAPTGTPAAGAQPSAAPAIAPPDKLTPDTPGSANVANWSEAARSAFNSTTPGTAVINGRVVSPQEIKALENRNVISSDAFRNPAPGVAASEATGGRTTLELSAGPTRGNAPQTGAGFIDRTYSGGLGGPPTQQEAAQKQMKSIVGQIETALGRGKRRTARELTSLLGTVGNINNDAQRNTIAGAPRPLSAAEQLMMGAQTENQQAQTQRERAQTALTGVEIGQRQQVAEVQAQLANTTDPAKRKELEGKLAALGGKAGQSAKDSLIKLRVPIGSGLDAREVELPYNPETNQLMIPDAMMQLMAPPAAEKKK